MMEVFSEPCALPVDLPRDPGHYSGGGYRVPLPFPPRPDPMRFPFWFLFLLALADLPARAGYVPREGDILFQTSLSSQSLAIQLVTKSPYTHCGIVQIHQGRPMVLEAVGPVRLEPMEDWIARGKGGAFWAKRLVKADALLTPKAVAALRTIGRRYMGRPYDHLFEWSDGEIYCSELVWKVYHQALGVELGALQPFSSLDLSSPEAMRIAKQRWGGKPPANQKLITPAAIAASPRLTQIFSR